MTRSLAIIAIVAAVYALMFAIAPGNPPPIGVPL
jgi:hypothetical protein